MVSTERPVVEAQAAVGGPGKGEPLPQGSREVSEGKQDYWGVERLWVTGRRMES